MNKKVFLIIIVFILLFFIWFMKSRKEDNIIQTEKYNEIYYETITNDGKNEYVIYNSKTGLEITRISEDEKYKIDIYETDPDYEEIPVEDTEIENGEILE